MRTSLSPSVLVLASALVMVGGCDSCSGHAPATSSAESEHAEGEGTEPEGEVAATPEPAVHPVGPLGWTALVESETDEGEYVEHRLLVWRTGPAEGERPSALPSLGHVSNWAGDYTLYIASEEPGAETPLTLLGVRGTCEATATRVLHLRVTFAPHHGEHEERLYDALEFEGCAGAFAFGAEGHPVFTELSTRTMETPPEEITAVVHDREQHITDEVGDEPMRLVGREIPELHVWVLAGWEAYVVRGDAIVAHTESNVLGAVTIGERTMLLMRGDDGPELVTPGEHSLDRVDPDADPNPPAAH